MILLNKFESLPKWAKNTIYAIIIAVLAFVGGKFSTPEKVIEIEKKIEIENTAEFKNAVSKKVETELVTLKASMEQEWKNKTKTIVVTKPDGTKVETVMTQNSSKTAEVQVKEVVKEVEVIKEVIVEKKVEVEKVVEKQVLIENKANWALGVTVQPLPLLKDTTDVTLGLSVERRVLGGIWGTLGLETAIKNFSPTYTLGIKLEF